MGFAVADELTEASRVGSLQLEELDLVFDGGICRLSSTSQASDVRQKRSITATACFGESLRIVSQNLELLGREFESSLHRLGFAEKKEYWEALRSSDSSSQRVLINLLDACLCGNNKGRNVWEDAVTLSTQYMKNYPDMSRDAIASKLVQWQASVNLSTGFVTGFGGFLSMPVTIPTGMLATWLTSTRLAFAVAHVHNHDVFHPCTINAVLYCLLGVGEGAQDDKPSTEEIIRARLQACQERRHGKEDLFAELPLVTPDSKQAGDAMLVHAASRAAAQLPCNVLRAVEITSAKYLMQAGAAAEIRSSVAAGERLAANAAAQSTSKLIPILGALISGAIDCATTASVGHRAARIFKQ